MTKNNNSFATTPDGVSEVTFTAVDDSSFNDVQGMAKALAVMTGKFEGKNAELKILREEKAQLLEELKEQRIAVRYLSVILCVSVLLLTFSIGSTWMLSKTCLLPSFTSLAEKRLFDKPESFRSYDAVKDQVELNNALFLDKLVGNQEEIFSLRMQKVECETKLLEFNQTTEPPLQGHAKQLLDKLDSFLSTYGIDDETEFVDYFFRNKYFQETTGIPVDLPAYAAGNQEGINVIQMQKEECETKLLEFSKTTEIQLQGHFKQIVDKLDSFLSNYGIDEETGFFDFFFRNKCFHETIEIPVDRLDDPVGNQEGINVLRTQKEECENKLLESNKTAELPLQGHDCTFFLSEYPATLRSALFVAMANVLTTTLLAYQFLLTEK